MAFWESPGCGPVYLGNTVINCRNVVPVSHRGLDCFPVACQADAKSPVWTPELHPASECFVNLANSVKNLLFYCSENSEETENALYGLRLQRLSPFLFRVSPNSSLSSAGLA